MKASVLIGQAAELLQDVSNVTWTEPQLLAWLSEAQRAVCIARPDASVTVAHQKLVPGVRQSVTGNKVLDVTMNTDSDGKPTGPAVRLVERRTRNANWMMATPDDEVREYMIDDRDPAGFLVYPPVNDYETDPSLPEVWVEVVQAVTPAEVSDANSDIAIKDIYSPALLEWMLYRALGRDSEDTPAMNRSQSHLQAFYGVLDVKMQVDDAASPKQEAHVR